MNASSAQRLPAELVDMIILNVLENEGYRVKGNRIVAHLCQFRNCNLDECGRSHKSLLDFAQVCQSFRQRALPRIWTFIKIEGKAYRSLNNFLFSTPNRENLYLQYVERISVFIHPDLDRGINKWFTIDSTQPFGVNITGRSYRVWLIKQSIYWIQRRNLRYVEFSEYSDDNPDILYKADRLLPFFLHISKLNGHVRCAHLLYLKRFRCEVGKSELPKEGDWLLKFVQNRLKERDERQSTACSSPLTLKEKNDNKLDEMLRDDWKLRKQVEKSYLNNWEVEKRNDFIYSKKSPDGCVHM